MKEAWTPNKGRNWETQLEVVKERKIEKMFENWKKLRGKEEKLIKLERGMFEEKEEGEEDIERSK